MWGWVYSIIHRRRWEYTIPLQGGAQKVVLETFSEVINRTKFGYKILVVGGDDKFNLTCSPLSHFPQGHIFNILLGVTQFYYS